MDKAHAVKQLAECLAVVADPRVDRTKKHRLSDILTIAVFAVIGGAESFEAMAEYGQLKHDWLKDFLDLENGIPSHDTFNRVFARLNPDELQEALMKWLTLVAGELPADSHIAIDGKSLRRSFQNANRQTAWHIIGAFATDLGLWIGQVSQQPGENEIIAIPRLIEQLNLQGHIVSIDAIACQKEIAAQLEKEGADYVLALKGNQPTVHEEVELFLADRVAKGFPNDSQHDHHHSVSSGHGRIETRDVYASNDLDWFADKGDWAGLNSVVRVECTFENSDGTRSQGVRHYLTSLPPDAGLLARVIRNHWRIESAHWSLDVVFREDDNRTRCDYAPENLAMLNRLAHSLVKRLDDNRSLKLRRRRAAIDNNYLIKIIHAQRIPQN